MYSLYVYHEIEICTTPRSFCSSDSAIYLSLVVALKSAQNAAVFQSDAKIDLLLLDLTSFKSVEGFAEEYKKRQW